MECEICGKPVPEHNPIRAKIEGSVMVVCKECSKLGKIQKAPPKPKYVQQKNKKQNGRIKKDMPVMTLTCLKKCLTMINLI